MPVRRKTLPVWAHAADVGVILLSFWPGLWRLRAVSSCSRRAPPFDSIGMAAAPLGGYSRAGRHVLVPRPATSRPHLRGFGRSPPRLAAAARAGGPLPEDAGAGPEARDLDGRGDDSPSARPGDLRWSPLCGPDRAHDRTRRCGCWTARVSRNYGDPLFSTWRLAWVAHQLPRDPCICSTPTSSIPSGHAGVLGRDAGARR